MSGAASVALSIRPDAELRSAVQRAKAAALAVRRRPVDEILDVLDRVVSRWLDPGYDLRRRAEAELPAVTGFSPEMVRKGLPFQLEPLRGDAIGALLDRELGSRHVVDGGDPQGAPPRLILHVLAGNIPALAASPMLLSLALKAAALVKPAAGEPVFAGLLRQSVAEVDPELAACLVVSNWRGGDVHFEDVAFGLADVVVASGSDDALAAIAPRVRGRFIGHGHRVSFAVVGAGSLANSAGAADIAERLAMDVTLWDQHGCLSPQLCYVESGSAVGIDEFGGLLGEALERLALDLPPRRRSLAEQAAVQRFRQIAEWRPGGRLLASDGSTAWSVSVERDLSFEPTCLHRCVRLKTWEHLSQLRDVLAPHRALFEAAGVAASRDGEATISDALAAAGVPNICTLGRMQMPTLDWRPGGRPRLAEWLVS